MKTHQTKFEDVLTARLLRFTAFVLLLLIFNACSETKKTQKAVNRVLADREAMNKVGAKWRDLNPCANTYKPGQWIELPDSANVTFPKGWGWGGPVTLMPGGTINPWPDAQIPRLIPGAPLDSNKAELIPNNPEGDIKFIGSAEFGPILTLTISPDEKYIDYKGRRYWYPQRRFFRVDTVKDNSYEDSLLANMTKLSFKIEALTGQALEKDKNLKSERARGDKWFYFFLAAVVVLIASHIVRSYLKVKLPI